MDIKVTNRRRMDELSNHQIQNTEEFKKDGLSGDNKNEK